jgi:hypothetical protein
MKVHTIKKLKRIGRLAKETYGENLIYQEGWRNRVMRLAQKNDLGTHWNTFMNGIDIVVAEIKPTSQIKNMKGFEWNGTLLTILLTDGSKVAFRQESDRLKSILTEDEYFAARDFRC